MKRKGSREHKVLKVPLLHCNGSLTKRPICSHLFSDLQHLCSVCPWRGRAGRCGVFRCRGGEEKEPLTLEPPASSESTILTQLTTFAVKAALVTQRQYFCHTQIFYVKIAIKHA